MDTSAGPVVLATTNGSGMGHLSRQGAVALALAGRPRAGRPEPVLFSMSVALPFVLDHLSTDAPLRGEYCPGYSRGWLPRGEWHRYLAERIESLLDETGARLLVFDGVAPYAGLLRARVRRPDVAFVWCRRGMWRPQMNRAALRATPFFDLVLEPGDVAAAADRGATASLDATRVAPVTLAEHVAPLPRAEAARALGLDPDRPAALVSLPTAAPPGGRSAAEVALRAFLATPDWQVAVTHAPIAALPGAGDDPGDHSRVVRLRGVYPLVAYLSAFDAAVSSAGYNAVHELLPAAVPTLFAPNPGVVTDDQPARARWASQAGVSLLAGTPDDLDAGVARLLDPGVRAQLAAACRALPPLTGASEAADVLDAVLSRQVRHRVSLTERRSLVGQDTARRVSEVLPPAATALLRRVLGRPPRAPEPVAERPLRSVLTERVDPALLREAVPVEHLLPRSSPAYRARRRAIATRYYRAEPTAEPAADPPSEPAADPDA